MQRARGLACHDATWAMRHMLGNQPRSLGCRTVGFCSMSAGEAERQLAERLARDHAVEKPEDWKKVTSAHVRSYEGGPRLLAAHGNSFSRLLSAAYPEEAWTRDARLFRPQVPKTYWTLPENRIRFFDGVKEKFGVTKQEEWAKVGVRGVKEEGGAGLLSRYGNSLLLALRDTYPDEHFDELSSVAQVPQGYWSKPENRRKFLDAASAALDVREPADFKRITNNDILKLPGGGSFLNQFGNSLATAISETYGPEFSLLACRKRVTSKYLGSKENQRTLLIHIGKRLGINPHVPEEWRVVTRTDILENGGTALLRRHKSVHETLAAVLGREGEEADMWQVYRCRPTVPAEFWESEANVRSFLVYSQERLGVEKGEDWRRVSRQQLRQANAAGLLKQMSFSRALEIAFPNEDWHQVAADGAKKRACQRDLFLSLRTLFAVEQQKQVETSS